LKYGACYTPNIETVFNYIYTPENVKVVTISSGDADSAEESTMNERKPTQDGGGDDIIYNLIKAALDQLPLVLPPSPLVVGQYARTDNARGVWKAPANVALNSVVKPTMKISMEDQAELNVHSTGKSINAIRAFTGKGILIWGARTLAGNDNEWRYVPVRRFFNMAEESIKKGTEAFVFEPNDANTWTRVKAMIDNFLTLQWRAGALQGIKPEHAFYVKVGLNETMTALDILEGRLIIEIGMAVVRPAEFIILRFSHKMAES
jgi:phage tail sheath protein FI